MIRMSGIVLIKLVPFNSTKSKAIHFGLSNAWNQRWLLRHEYIGAAATYHAELCTKCYTLVLYGIPALNSHEEFQFFYIIKISASLMLLNCVHPLVFFKLFKMFHLQTPLHLNCGLNSEVSLTKLSNLLLMEHQPFNKSISLIYGPIWYRQNELLLVACSLQFDQQQSQTSINTIQIWQSYHIQKD